MVLSAGYMAWNRLPDRWCERQRIARRAHRDGSREPGFHAMGSMRFIYLRASSSLTMHTGIRLALGAQPHDVLRMVAVHGLSIALFGIGIGLACAAALTRVLASLLYGVGPSDSLTFAAVPLLLAVVALSASAAPAWRASRVDPAVALRQE